MKFMLARLLTVCTVFLAAVSIDTLAYQESNSPLAAGTFGRNQLIEEVKNENKEIALPDDAINKLVINAGFGWGIFSGNIYNGNSNYTLTRLIVSMTPKHDHHVELPTMSPSATREYTIELNLQPLSKGALSLALDYDNTHVHDFEWKIIKAMGYEHNTVSDSKR